MKFEDVFREERYYCNHFFRLLCHEKESGGTRSGLGAVLAKLDLYGDVSPSDVAASNIYAEVSAFRDVYAATEDKKAFLEQLYDLLMQRSDVNLPKNSTPPLRPSELRNVIGPIHPSKYADAVAKNAMEECTLKFYREFSGLFSAKPDFLVTFRDRMLWFEAKFCESFSKRQLGRTRAIAHLCGTDLFREYFGNRESLIVLLGDDTRHRNASVGIDTRFLSWKNCHSIAVDVFPGGERDYTAESFARMPAVHRNWRKTIRRPDTHSESDDMKAHSP